MSKLRVGMGNSYGLRIVVLANADFLPLSVTAGVIKITKPTAVAGVTTTVDWTATLSAQSSGSVTATYTFNASALDLDFAGQWRAWIQWTVPGQTPGPRTEVIAFTVAPTTTV